MLQLQIVDTAFCPETRITPRVQSGRPPVNRTVVNEAANELALKPGMKATAVIKASDVMVGV